MPSPFLTPKSSQPPERSQLSRLTDLQTIGAGLPFAEALPRLFEVLEEGACVVQAPPGTGKTTLVPPAVVAWLCGHGPAAAGAPAAGLTDAADSASTAAPAESPSEIGRIIVTQPRRIAARSAAHRLCELTGTRLGDEIGYTVKGDHRSGAHTLIEFVTPGVVVQRLVADPELAAVSAVVLDEVHERSLDTDLLVGMLAELRQLREDLVLVAMSATVDAPMFARCLAGLPPEAAGARRGRSGSGETGEGAGGRGAEARGNRVSSRKDRVGSGGCGADVQEEHVGAQEEHDAGPSTLTRVCGVPIVDTPAVAYPLDLRYEPFHGPKTRGGSGRVNDEFLQHIAATTVSTVARTPADWDALVFVPGIRDVENTAACIRSELARARGGLSEQALGEQVRGAGLSGCTVHVLHGQLSAREQDEVIRPPARKATTRENARRIIVATSIAESSLTVPGVRIVVDGCLSREPRLDTAREMTGLVTVGAAQSSMNQRAGRAARVGPGIAVRCCSAADFAAAPAHITPEIAASDLTAAVLSLACWGTAVSELPLPSLPPVRAWALAVRALGTIGALELSPGRRGSGLGGVNGSTPGEVQGRGTFEVRGSERALAGGNGAVGNAGSASAPDGNGAGGSAAEGDASSDQALAATMNSALTVTEHGRTLARFPVDPRIAHGVLAAGPVVGLDTACGVAALVSDLPRSAATDFREQLRSFEHGRSPEASRWRAETRRLAGIVKSVSGGRAIDGTAGTDAIEPEYAAGFVIACCFPGRIARAVKPHSATYLLASGTRAEIPKTAGNAAATSSGSGAASASAKSRASAAAAGPATALAHSEWLAVAEVQRAASASGALIRSAAPLSPQAAQLAGQRLLSTQLETRFARSGALQSRRVTTLGAIEVSSVPCPTPPDGARAAWATELAAASRAATSPESALALFSPSPAVLSELRRLAFLHDHLGSPWPDVALLLTSPDAVCSWLAAELDAVAAGSKPDSVDLAPAVQRLMPWDHPADAQLFAELAPEVLLVPSGRQVRISWPEIQPPRSATADAGVTAENEGGDRGHAGDQWGIGSAGVSEGSEERADHTGAHSPVVSVKLQECFGLAESPRVGVRPGYAAETGIPVVFHLLSPAGRPLAVTSDLASFWNGAYAQVRAEMRGRYPKHPWPEDPWNAPATAKTNRALRGS